MTLLEHEAQHGFYSLCRGVQRSNIALDDES